MATHFGYPPTVMSVGCLVLVFTSIVDTVPLPWLATNAVLPSRVNATPTGPAPTAMSVGCLVLVFTSIVDTVPPSRLVTNAVARHRPRPATAATSSGTTLTSAPDNTNTTTTRADRNRRITAPASLSHQLPLVRPIRAYVALGLCE